MWLDGIRNGRKTSSVISRRFICGGFDEWHDVIASEMLVPTWYATVGDHATSWESKRNPPLLVAAQRNSMLTSKMDASRSGVKVAASKAQLGLLTMIYDTTGTKGSFWLWVQRTSENLIYGNLGWWQIKFIAALVASKSYYDY